MDVNISHFNNVYINHQISNSSNHMHYITHWYGCKYLSLKSATSSNAQAHSHSRKASKPGGDPNACGLTQVTPMHVAYEEAKKDAAEIGVAVTGSELVGFLIMFAICSKFVMFSSQKSTHCCTGWPCSSRLPAGCRWVLHGEGGSDGTWGGPKGDHGHDYRCENYIQWRSN